MSHLLRLTKNCLSFDFIGSSTDESADDMNNVQVSIQFPGTFEFLCDFSKENLIYSKSTQRTDKIKQEYDYLFSLRLIVDFLTHIFKSCQFMYNYPTDMAYK